LRLKAVEHAVDIPDRGLGLCSGLLLVRMVKELAVGAAAAAAGHLGVDVGQLPELVGRLLLLPFTPGHLRLQTRQLTHFTTGLYSTGFHHYVRKRSRSKN
jgi:hypothetical protein